MLSRKSWIGAFEGLGFEGAFFEDIHLRIWGICWVAEGGEFDHHLALNYFSKCPGKWARIICERTKSQHKIQGVWNLEKKNNTCE